MWQRLLGRRQWRNYFFARTHSGGHTRKRFFSFWSFILVQGSDLGRVERNNVSGKSLHVCLLVCWSASRNVGCLVFLHPHEGSPDLLLHFCMDISLFLSSFLFFLYAWLDDDDDDDDDGTGCCNVIITTHHLAFTGIFMLISLISFDCLLLLVS